MGKAVPILKRWEEFAAELATHPLANAALALVCSPELLVQYEGTDDQAPRVVIASYPFIRPFVPQARCVRECMVLSLNRKRLRLFEFAAGICRDAQLPIGVPSGLLEAGAFDVPDHQLQNRSPAGMSVGSPAVVTFGTSSEREHRFGHVEHFFALVDAGLHTAFAGRPLLLAGLQEEIAAYRRVTNYGHILSADLPGNWDHHFNAEIASAVSSCLVLEEEQSAARAFAAFSNKLDRTRTLTDPHETLISSAEGRVHQLFVRSGSEVMAKLPPNLDRAGIPSEDLINAAVCETLRHGGDVFELPKAVMAAERPVAAILRF